VGLTRLNRTRGLLIRQLALRYSLEYNSSTAPKSTFVAALEIVGNTQTRRYRMLRDAVTARFDKQSSFQITRFLSFRASGQTNFRSKANGTTWCRFRSILTP